MLFEINGWKNRLNAMLRFDAQELCVSSNRQRFRQHQPINTQCRSKHWNTERSPDAHQLHKLLINSFGIDWRFEPSINVFERSIK